METVRCDLLERGLERGCRFMITANLLDDMRFHLLFNRLGRDTQRVLDRERRAGAVRDDANSIDAEKGAAAVFLVIRFISDGGKRVARAKSAGLSQGCAQQF